MPEREEGQEEGKHDGGFHEGLTAPLPDGFHGVGLSTRRDLHVISIDDPPYGSLSAEPGKRPAPPKPRNGTGRAGRSR
jgi:hypothetical protein